MLHKDCVNVVWLDWINNGRQPAGCYQILADTEGARNLMMSSCLIWAPPTSNQCKEQREKYRHRNLPREIIQTVQTLAKHCVFLLDPITHRKKLIKKKTSSGPLKTVDNKKAVTYSVVLSKSLQLSFHPTHYLTLRHLLIILNWYNDDFLGPTWPWY